MFTNTSHVILSGNNLKKCRARYGLDQQNQWCKPCRWVPSSVFILFSFRLCKIESWLADGILNTIRLIILLFLCGKTWLSYLTYQEWPGHFTLAFYNLRKSIQKLCSCYFYFLCYNTYSKLRICLRRSS